MPDDAHPHEEQPTGLSWIAINRPISVVVGIVLVVLFGALSVIDLPIQLTPDIATPTISVNTTWPGAAPVEIETEILEPQEEVLKNVQGLTRMESTAGMDGGSVTLEFEVDTVIEEALVRVTNRLSQVSSYPDAVREPVVETANSSGPPLAVVAIRDPHKGSVAAYRTWVQDDILPEIDRIPGVAGIFFIGGQDTEVHVLFDAQALAARGLSVQGVADRVRDELRDLSGGDVTLGKRRYLVRTTIAPKTPSALEEVVLGASSDGTPIVLGDVATVKLALRKPRGVAIVQDRPAMVMLLSREAGTNVLEVTQDVHRVIERLQREKFSGEGLKIEVLADQVEYIEGALDLVKQNLLLGAMLAIVVLFLFLRTFGASAVISIAIPVCAFATALGMQALGRTINVVSLAGIAFAIGMVVDNSIVVLENIYRHIQRGENQLQSVLVGTRDVTLAIFASTATTVVVFLPIGLIGGMIGAFFLPFGIAVTYALASSFIVAITIVPLLAFLFIRKEHLPPEGETALQRRYHPLLKWALDNRLWTLLIATVLLAGSMFLFSTRPRAFLPDFGEVTITANVDLSGDVQMADTNELVIDFEESLSDIEGIDVILTEVGSGGLQSRMLGTGVDQSQASISIGIEPGTEIETLTAEIRQQAEAVFGQDSVIVSSGTLSSSGFGGFSLVASGTPELLEEFNDAAILALNEIDGLANATSNLTNQDATLRVDGEPAISFSGELETDDTLGLTEAAKAALIEIAPEGVTISEGFQTRQQTEGFAQAIQAMGISVIIVYIVMVLTFRSFVHPFTILFSLPLAVIGAALALWITNSILGLSSLVGMMMLVGIVVTNAIVLVDRVQTNHTQRGMSTRESLLEAGKTRLRPILMTALAAILALVPLAIGLSEGAIIAAELAIVVIGGLTTSTLLTLLVVPVMYSLLDRFSRNSKKQEA